MDDKTMLRRAERTIDELAIEAVILKQRIPDDGKQAWARILRIQHQLAANIATYLGDCLED